MSYKGEHFRVSCAQGGFSHNSNLDVITPSEMIHPSRNLNYFNNGREPRGGTSHVLDSAYTDTPQIMGLYNFIMTNNDNNFIVACCKDGKIYKDGSTTIHPALQTTEEYFWDFEVFDNELYMVNGKNTPLKWTGSGNASALTAIPSDWTGGNMPSWIVKHGRGNSERMWAGGCPTSTPWTIYASKNSDADALGDGDVVTIKINTGDGYGIVGATEFGDRLICFGKNNSYIIDDLDPTAANWGYDTAQWEGGVATNRLVCRTPNDIVCMQDDGEIYSVLAAEKYGDYQAASLTRMSYMHEWIKEFVDLSSIKKFHSIYDPRLRAIKVFVLRNGQSEIDAALVYSIDRSPEEAWMIHGNWASASGYDASASCFVRQDDGPNDIYTGDYSGMIWRLEQNDKNDNNNAFYSGFKTGYMHFGRPETKKHFKRLWMTVEPKGQWDMTIDWSVDGVQQTRKTVSLAGLGAALGGFTLGTSKLGGDELIDSAVNLGMKGRRVQFEIYNNSADQGFFVSGFGIDYRNLGREPS